MRRYRLSAEADEDMVAVYLQGYDRFSPLQADRYHDELEALFERLAEFPELGRLRHEYYPPVRIAPHKAHVIVYEETPDGVLIIRVRHGHEDWRFSPAGRASLGNSREPAMEE